MGLIRIEDKLNRLKNLLLLKEEIRTEESIIDTVLDIAGYAVLFSIYLKEQGGNNEK
nr:nucleotide modification associated domain-containing protein [Brachyspira hyodysenteriae]